MRSLLVALIASAACGRIGFDALSIGVSGSDGSNDGGLVGTGSGDAGASTGATGGARCTANGPGSGTEQSSMYSLGINPTGPRALAAADLDHNGIIDLAVVDGDRATVDILIGGAGGSFTDGATLSVGTGGDPRSIVAVDLDGDGALDLITGNTGTNNLTIFLGKGDGTFGTGTHVTTDATPSGFAVADFNGDGHPDLAVTAFGSNVVDVLTGDAAGTLTLSAIYAVAAEPYGIATADLDGDGQLDLVVACDSAQEVDVLYGAGGGKFGAASKAVADSGFPNGISIVDVDGDGRDDLVIADGGASIALGTATGFQTPAVQVDTGMCGGAQAAVLGDFNCDGIPDLAVPSGDSSGLCIVPGTGPATFGSSTSYMTGEYPEDVVVGDFNGDGRPDVATADYFGVDATVLLGPFD
jgi:hypothetical protein